MISNSISLKFGTAFFLTKSAWRTKQTLPCALNINTLYTFKLEKVFCYYSASLFKRYHSGSSASVTPTVCTASMNLLCGLPAWCLHLPLSSISTISLDIYSAIFFSFTHMYFVSPSTEFHSFSIQTILPPPSYSTTHYGSDGQQHDSPCISMAIW